MNIFLLEKNDFENSEQVVLTGRHDDHARKVLGLKENDEVKVGVINGKLGRGTVVECGKDFFRLRVELTQDPPKKHDVTLILALPRPPVLRRLLSAATTMGISKIILTQTARVEKSYWSSPALTKERIDEALILGLEQARDTVMPEVVLEKRFKPFVEDRLPDIVSERICLLAHPEHAQACPENLNKPIILAVGPEGGFVVYEVEKFYSLGFQAVHLGERILRVETAVSSLIGRLMSIR